MKVLMIHDFPPVEQARRQLINHSFFYPKYRPGTELTLHAVGDPLDRKLLEEEYDAIFLDVTLLCWRWAKPKSALTSLLERYSWVASHDALKIAFPQDDYDHQSLLDDWLSDWNVDVVCTPLAEFAEVLYPKTRTKAMIVPFQTGYVDDIDLKIGEGFRTRLSERDVDVVYRARPLPANFGRLGRLKTLAAERMGPELEGAGFKTNISTDPSATIFGDQWLGFLGSSRFVLGTPSGSSVLDPVGDIGDCVRRYGLEHPGAPFEEVYDRCIPESAARYWMAAISPRTLEAALTQTCQVLIRGEYGPLEADRHYIPIEPDFSNLAEVVDRMRDLTQAQCIADQCYELVTGDPSLHYRHAVDILDRALTELRGEGDALVRAQGGGAVSIERVVERQIRARIGASQRLVSGFAHELGEGVTGDAIQVARVSEIAYVLGDRWGRMQKNLRSLSSAYQASLAANEELAGQQSILESKIADLNERYIALHAQYDDLYKKPKALVGRLRELLFEKLSGRLKRG